MMKKMMTAFSQSFEGSKCSIRFLYFPQREAREASSRLSIRFGSLFRRVRAYRRLPLPVCSAILTGPERKVKRNNPVQKNPCLFALHRYNRFAIICRAKQCDTLFAPWRMDYIRGEKPEGCVLCRDSLPEEELVVSRGRIVSSW